MSRQSSTSTSLQPFTLWTQLALRSFEMWHAAAQVIGMRTGRMAAASHPPSARDRKEFTLMGTEKVQAATHANLAMARRLQGSSLHLWSNAWQQWLRGGVALAPLSAEAARVGLAGLAPVHRAATGNARRLARVRTTPRTRRS